MSNPVLKITLEAYRKMLITCRLVEEQHNKEVLGLLVVEEGKNGKGLTVTDIIIPEQTIHSSTCKMEISKTFTEIPKKLVPKIKGWFHSHKNMGTWYSSTDDETLENWSYNNNYAIGIVVSLPNKMQAFIQWGKPFQTEKVELSIELVTKEDPELEDKIKKELERKIIKPKKEKPKRVVTHTVFKPYNLYASPYITDNAPHATWKQKGKQKESKAIAQDKKVDNKDFAYWLGIEKTEPVVKEVKELVNEANKQYELKYKPVHINDLPDSTEWGCIRLNFDNEKDVICDLSGKDPECLNCKKKTLMFKETKAVNFVQPKQPQKLSKKEKKRRKRFWKRQGKKQERKEQKEQPVYFMVNTRCVHLEVLASEPYAQILPFNETTKRYIRDKDIIKWSFICNLGLELNCAECKALMLKQGVKKLEHD